MKIDPAVTMRDNFSLEKVIESPKKNVHLVCIATKPDIIKQAPIYLELKKKQENLVLVHTGQHYDFNLSGGLEEEFGIKPDINLNIKGHLHHKIGQIISRLGDIFLSLKENGKTVVPYVHGDTSTAMAVSNTAFQNEFASVHVEAGLRALTPKYDIYKEVLKKFDFNTYLDMLSRRENYEAGSLEPYPEQFNTRCADAGTGLFCAPVELNADFLYSEGFPEDRIFVCGNSVGDAVEIARKEAKKSNIFEKYPILQEGFVRFCVHRRENCISQKRFTTIFNAIKKIVEKGRNVLFISLFATEAAIDNFGLRGEMEKLQKKKNFIYSKVWPFYHDVIAAMEKCSVCATDSGSMQEEMNIMKIPCVTLRFGSDRPETFLAGCNMPAPPIDSDLMVKIIESCWDNQQMKGVSNLYGNQVSQKIISRVFELIKNKESLFRFEEDRMGIGGG